MVLPTILVGGFIDSPFFGIPLIRHGDDRLMSQPEKATKKAEKNNRGHDVKMLAVRERSSTALNN